MSFVDDFSPVLVFLTEPQIYQCDINPMFSMFGGSFSFHLNSQDLLSPDLPLVTRKAAGGTMAMWRSELDPYIKVLPTSSSAVLPLILSLPGRSATAHVTVYLPTHGREADFVSALGVLDSSLLQIKEDFSCPIYVRGDLNVNPKNTARVNMLETLCTKFSLSNPDFGHPTHHHFVGNGAFDTQLDRLLYSGPIEQAESLPSIVCSLSNPLVNSHHDLLHSSIPLPPEASVARSENLVEAPKVPNTRVKIIWDENGISKFEDYVSPSLARLRKQWLPPFSSAGFSLLLSATNDALSLAAQTTNKVLDLSIQRKAKVSVHPEVKDAQNRSLKAARKLRHLSGADIPNLTEIAAAKLELSDAKSESRTLERAWQQQVAATRDQQLHTVLTENPRRLFSHIRSSKSGAQAKIQALNVTGKVYRDSSVADGFFDSLSALKAPDLTTIHSSSSYCQIKQDYEHVVKICSAGLQIPPISGKDAMLLLHSLKPEVNDLYSITPAHYINAGMEGAIHFSFLLNCVISNVNLSSIDELNSVWAMVLFKGHGKDRESDRSYRTISTCPFISKALDRYIGSLFESGWAAAQASTQFQGNGSSHELAALLVTEVIQHSLFVAKSPVFVLFLDAKSAFDKILREICIRAAFLAGSSGHGLVFLDNRLKNRKTFVEWEKCLMGPIHDLLGVEQGGVLSDRLYKLANNAELTLTHRSNLGVQLGPTHVASVGQADDVALVSGCPHKLRGLLSLALEYAEYHHVTMVPEKTKLLCYTPDGCEQLTHYWEHIYPLSMNGLLIPYSLEAEHVGILRSTAPGEMSSIVDRISAHTRALHAVLPSGLARRHHGNPAASLRVHQLYGIPVLLSGLAALVLGKAELDALDHHHKVTLERLMRFYPATPAPVVYFFAGSPPARAHLHSRQLGLLGMVARLGPNCPLFSYGMHILANPPQPARSASKIWFLQVRGLCQQYGLPDPVDVLQSAPTQGKWKSAVKRQITAYWTANLRSAGEELPSLAFLRLSHMSLSSPSAVLTSCSASQLECKKATVQLRMASGRYRTCWLRRYWSGDPSGTCQVPQCIPDTPGTLSHLVTGQCKGLAAATASAAATLSVFASSRPHLHTLLTSMAAADPETFAAFLLNPSTQAPVLALAQEHGHQVVDDLCHLTRTWLYTLHCARYRALGLWQFL